MWAINARQGREREELVDPNAVESYRHGCYVTKMPTAWQILRDGGLPLAIEGTTTHRTAGELARALELVIAEDPRGRDAEAVAAFVRAWHHHWQRSFADELGDRAAAILAWAENAITDHDRYLKLRRIAIENLAAVL